MKTIGTITRLTRDTMTVYHQHAADTDYVTVEPQTVELRTDGYWLLATFAGTLTSTTRQYAMDRIGQPEPYHMQTQAFGAPIMHSPAYRVDLLPEWECAVVGIYPEGCTNPGSPILAIRPRQQAAA